MYIIVIRTSNTHSFVKKKNSTQDRFRKKSLGGPDIYYSTPDQLGVPGDYRDYL